jgi:hypothetical protein
MDSRLDPILEAGVRGLCGEGRKLLQLRLNALLLRVMRGLRRALLLQYALLIACFVWALAFFSAGWMLADRGMSLFHGGGSWPPPFLFSLALLAVASLALFLTVRERAWSSALGIPETLADWAESEKAPGPPTEQELSAIVERVLERKLAELAERRMEASKEAAVPREQGVS